jgi:hypothetical protein
MAEKKDFDPLFKVDPEEYIKRYKIKLPPELAPGKPATTGAAPTTAPPISTKPPETSEEEFSYPGAIGRGLSRGAIGSSLDLTNLATSVGPFSIIGLLLNQIPGLKEKKAALKEWSEGTEEEKAKESWTEFGARQAGGMIPYSLVPEGMAEGAFSRWVAPWLARRFTSAPTTVTKMTPQFVRGQGFTAVPTTTTIPGTLSPARAKTISSLEKLSKQVVDPAITGAIGGGAAQPEHPWEGMAEGAVGGLAGRGLGTKWGQRVGSFALPELAWVATHGLTGLPYYPFAGPAAVHLSGLGPLGRKAMRGISRANPAIFGSLASRKLSDLSETEQFNVILDMLLNRDRSSPKEETSGQKP